MLATIKIKPYICTNKKTNNKLKKLTIMKELINEIGAYNNWKGFVGLYLTKRQLSEVAKDLKRTRKEVESLTIKQVYSLYL